MHGFLLPWGECKAVSYGIFGKLTDLPKWKYGKAKNAWDLSIESTKTKGAEIWCFRANFCSVLTWSPLPPHQVKKNFRWAAIFSTFPFQIPFFFSDFTSNARERTKPLPQSKFNVPKKFIIGKGCIGEGSFVVMGAAKFGFAFEMEFNTSPSTRRQLWESQTSIFCQSTTHVFARAWISRSRKPNSLKSGYKNFQRRQFFILECYILAESDFKGFSDPSLSSGQRY